MNSLYTCNYSVSYDYLITKFQTDKPNCKRRSCIMHQTARGRRVRWHYTVGNYKQVQFQSNANVYELLKSRDEWLQLQIVRVPNVIRSECHVLSVFVSVCLSVRWHIFSGTRRPKFHQIFCALTVAVAGSSSSGVAICCVLPVLRMTFCFSHKRPRGSQQVNSYPLTAQER